MNAKLKEKKWFTPIEASQIMRSLISGVAYFHSKNIVHRDIKPGNTFHLIFAIL